MEENIKKEYHITVNDNVFRTKNVGFHAVLLFIICFAAQFIISCILEQFKIVGNEHIRDNLPAIKILINGREYAVKYDEIAEVDKMMVIDRIHDEKGCYRMKIKCHGRSSLEFETTAQEYEKHLYFEDTELFVFYDACKRAGIKCC